MGALVKECTIINSRFSYILKVDGYEIPFNGAGNADYFKKQYEGWGYTVLEIDESEISHDNQTRME